MIVQSCIDGRTEIVHTFDAAFKVMREWWKASYPKERVPKVEHLQAYYCCKDDNKDCVCDAMVEFIKTPRET